MDFGTANVFGNPLSPEVRCFPLCSTLYGSHTVSYAGHRC